MYCHETFAECSSLNKITLPIAEPKSLGIQRQLFLERLARVNWRTWFFEKTVNGYLHHQGKVAIKNLFLF